jgi:ribosome-binding factor A
MADRIDKVNSLLQHEISKLISRDFAFSPEILVTLTRVDTAANMIETKVYISVFPEAKSDGILNAFNKSVQDIQYKINRTLKMRPIPRIRFVKETEIAKAARIEELLYKASQQENNLPEVEKNEEKD